MKTKFTEKEIEKILTPKDKDKVFSCRINDDNREFLKKKYGSLQRFLDRAILLERFNLTKPLDKVLFEIENKEALETYYGYTEPDDKLDKQVQK